MGRHGIRLVLLLALPGIAGCPPRVPPVEPTAAAAPARPAPPLSLPEEGRDGLHLVVRFTEDHARVLSKDRAIGPFWTRRNESPDATTPIVAVLHDPRGAVVAAFGMPEPEYPPAPDDRVLAFPTAGDADFLTFYRLRHGAEPRRLDTYRLPRPQVATFLDTGPQAPPATLEFRGASSPVDPTSIVDLAVWTDWNEEGCDRGQEVRRYTYWSSGPPERRLDVTFLGEGYAQDELSAYRERAHGLAAGLLGTDDQPGLAPFRDLRTRINVQVVTTYSETTTAGECPGSGSAGPTYYGLLATDGRLAVGCVESIDRAAGNSGTSAQQIELRVLLVNCEGAPARAVPEQQLVLLPRSDDELAVLGRQLGRLISGVSPGQACDATAAVAAGIRHRCPVPDIACGGATP